MIIYFNDEGKEVPKEEATTFVSRIDDENGNVLMEAFGKVKSVEGKHEAWETEERDERGRWVAGAEGTRLTESTTHAVLEDPKRMFHGYIPEKGRVLTTSDTGFWITEKGNIHPHKDLAKIPKEERKNLINVHSHAGMSRDNSGKLTKIPSFEGATSFSGGDFTMFKTNWKNNWSTTMAVMVKPDEMDVVRIPDKTDEKKLTNFYKLSNAGIEKEFHVPGQNLEQNREHLAKKSEEFGLEFIPGVKFRQYPAEVDDLITEVIQEDGEAKTLTEKVKTLYEKRLAGHLALQDNITNIFSKYEISGRMKSIPSIEEKMKRKGIKDPSKLDDISGLRIITKNANETQDAIKTFKEHFKDKIIPGTEDNYIENPKDTGYHAYHATVRFGGEPHEVQVRTKNFNTWAELYHSVYKGEDWAKKADTPATHHYFKESASILQAMDEGKTNLKLPPCPPELASLRLCL